ncbi:MAG: glycosyltransferase [Aquisalimonadaceae bacterium]
MWNIAIIGLSISSSWGNGHATTYRGLVRELVRRGHVVTFLERDVPWYRDTRDLPRLPHGRILFYDSLAALFDGHEALIRNADLVIVGSYVPDGAAVCRWSLAHARGVTAFYDIDTPVTLAALERRQTTYISRDLIPRFDLYLSFTGGPTLQRLERDFGARRARALYCSVDPMQYFPDDVPCRWDLGYLGTHAEDRQPALDHLLLAPARTDPGARFVVAGANYPADMIWPDNVERIAHLPPAEHRAFYNSQRFTLNITRADMIASGYAPSVRLFEAAACGTPVISDWWPGLDELFRPEEEIFTAGSAAEVLGYLNETPDEVRQAVGEQARQEVLTRHTAACRVRELEDYVEECLAPPAARRAP